MSTLAVESRLQVHQRINIAVGWPIKDSQTNFPVNISFPFLSFPFLSFCRANKLLIEPCRVIAILRYLTMGGESPLPSSQDDRYVAFLCGFCCGKPEETLQSM